tara:strand:- start:258 stop:770 length:513 start_codon:yes stop_codon:yes gene_type:complete
MDFGLDTLKSIFLLFLVVSGNFIGELLGCKTRQIFTNNIYIKHIILIFLIYFTIDLTEEKNEHPIELMKKTIVIWLLFVIGTKTHYKFTYLIIILLFSLYMIDEYELYLKDNKKKYDKDLFKKWELYIQYLILAVLISGFFVYLSKQKRDKKDFSYFKFIFGTTKCSKIN